MGCHFTGNPPRAEPDAGSIQRVVLAIWELQTQHDSIPCAVSSLLSVYQWFALLARPGFAVFRDGYVFTSRRPLNVALPIPRCVQEELALFSTLAPLIKATLSRSYAPIIVASDAVPEFGFGVSIASSRALLGGGATTFGSIGTVTSIGSAQSGRHKIALRSCDFRHVLSVRVKRIEHSAVLELDGVLFLPRWLSRVPRHHGKRLLVLLDVKAVLGALQKGRCSSRSLGWLAQCVAAYALACDFLPR